LFYARQAVFHSPNNFSARNEVGNCLLEFEGADASAEAQRYLFKSPVLKLAPVRQISGSVPKSGPSFRHENLPIQYKCMMALLIGPD